MALVVFAESTAEGATFVVSQRGLNTVTIGSESRSFFEHLGVSPVDIHKLPVLLTNLSDLNFAISLVN